MTVLFCDSVFDNTSVEPDYEGERDSALRFGFNVSLLSFEELCAGNIEKALRFIKASTKKEVAIYRGWMLNPRQYSALYEGLLSKNVELINSPEQYTHCHYFPESYNKIESKTPKSYWTTDLDEASILKCAAHFGDHPIIVKDFVKSEKHDWETACFIPRASDKKKLLEVVRNFLKLRGDSLNEGIVFRKFEGLEFLTAHSKSGMPLTKEFRIFFAKNEIVKVYNYWDEGTYGESKPQLETFLNIAQTIESNFFTMDVAQKKSGDWIIMELGDGQVAGLPDQASENEFYDSLFKILPS